MAIALFILGHAASGKTTLACNWIKSQNRNGYLWCLMDKDNMGDIMAPILMKQMGLDPFDRDSQTYKDNVRDLEYLTCLNVAKEQLKLGINVVLPGPWTKELISGDIFSAKSLKLPENTQIEIVYLDIPQHILKQRIESRNNPRDKWKIDNWPQFEKTLKKPSIIDDKNILTFNVDGHFKEKEKLIVKNLIANQIKYN